MLRRSGLFCAGIVGAGAGERGVVSAEDDLGVGRFEVGKTTSMTRFERVRRADGPGAAFWPLLVAFSGSVTVGLLGAPGAWALAFDRVFRAEATGLRLGRGGIR